MTETDVFERRLRAALVRHVAGAPTDFDALGFARMVAAKEPRRRGLAAAITLRRPMALRPAWALLLLAGLLVALAGGALIGSRLILDRLDGPVPPPAVRWATPPDRWVLDPVPPLRATRIAAVSADEAWATDGDALWHFVDGAWAGPFTKGLAALTVLEAAGGAARLGEIAVAPDGTVWGIGASGLARFRGGTWEMVLPRASQTVSSGADATPVTMAFFASLAVGADGMAWAGTMGDLATSFVYGLDPATGEVTRSVCGYSSAITMARDGSLYVWGTNWGMGHQLWVLRNGTCERLDPPWDGTSVWVDDVVADPAGGVQMILRERDGPPWNPRLVRFDGGQWVTLASIADDGDARDLAAIDAAGGAWISTYGFDGVLRFDGMRWVEIAGLVGGPIDLSMALDGTAWIAGSSGVERLLPTWDGATSSPTPAAEPTSAAVAPQD